MERCVTYLLNRGSRLVVFGEETSKRELVGTKVHCGGVSYPRKGRGRGRSPAELKGL